MMTTTNNIFFWILLVCLILYIPTMVYGLFKGKPIRLFDITTVTLGILSLLNDGNKFNYLDYILLPLHLINLLFIIYFEKLNVNIITLRKNKCL
jgi:hypothetical protein